MEDQIFQIAYEASRHSMVEYLWQRMDPRERTALIYREMRRIDGITTLMQPQDIKAGHNPGFGA